MVAGDSLSAIAAAHSLEGGWQKLYQDNRRAVGANPSLIHPGLELTVGGETVRLTPGMVMPIPSNVPHTGQAITPCDVLDVFAPVRDDYR